MAQIRPFRGIRFNPDMVKNLGAVITPPYDTIDPDEQERLHQKSPYNIIRIEYGKNRPKDDETDNRYTRASAALRQWLESDILKPDKQGRYYFFEQSFIYQGEKYCRRGIFAALKLKPYSTKEVLPHESTMAGPKKDRLRLLWHTASNISPIFTLYPDPANRSAEFFSKVKNTTPLAEASDQPGRSYRLWAVDDPTLQEELTDYIGKQSLLIADGHHRYETALDFYRQSDPDLLAGAGFILAALVSMKDPGLLVLPTHRLLNDLSPALRNILQDQIAANFNVQDMGDSKNLSSNRFFNALKEVSSKNRGFAFLDAQQTALLTPLFESDDLPVKILHEQLINPVLKNGGSLHFSHDFKAVFDELFERRADAAFVLDAVPIDEVYERARRGRLMPQKSTYFYPKLPGGLVIYHMGLSRVSGKQIQR